VTLDDLLTAARAEPGPGPANRRFWTALRAEIGHNLARHPYAKRVEIEQRVLLIVWGKVDRYEQQDADSLRRWVRAIIRLEVLHTASEAARLARLETQLLRETACSPGLTPSRHVLRLERARLAQAAAEQLCERHRRALAVADLHKIAAFENITVKAAGMLFHRALRRLIQLMRQVSKDRGVRFVTSI
jgi:hypothetical protein